MGVKEKSRRSGFLAVPTGFEPAISALTGRRVEPLHYGTREAEFTMPKIRRQASHIESLACAFLGRYTNLNEP